MSRAQEILHQLTEMVPDKTSFTPKCMEEVVTYLETLEKNIPKEDGLHVLSVHGKYSRFGKVARCPVRSSVYVVSYNSFLRFVLYVPEADAPFRSKDGNNDRFCKSVNVSLHPACFGMCAKCGSSILLKSGMEAVSQRVYVHKDTVTGSLSALVVMSCADPHCWQATRQLSDRSLGICNLLPFHCITCHANEATLFCRRCGMRMYCSAACREEENVHEFFCPQRVEKHTRQNSKRLALRRCVANSERNQIYLHHVELLKQKK